MADTSETSSALHLDEPWLGDCRTCRELTLRDGEILYLEGSRDLSAWMIRSGYLKLTRISRDGRQYTLAILGPGDLAGCVGGEEDTASEEATAKGEVRLLQIDPAEMRTLIEKNGAFARRVVECLARRSRYAETRSASLLFDDVRTRLITTLLERAVRYAEPCIHGLSFDVHLTQQELADLTGASRPVVSTILNELRDAGLLVYARNYFCVGDVTRLQQILRG